MIVEALWVRDDYIFIQYPDHDGWLIHELNTKRLAKRLSFAEADWSMFIEYIINTFNNLHI